MKIEDVIEYLEEVISASSYLDKPLNESHILISRDQAKMIVDALIISVKEISPKLNGTVVEDEIMGQAITHPEWHLDPTSLPATREDVINNMRFVMDSIDNLSSRLQTIEKKML